MKFSFAEETKPAAIIKVVGCGGGGNNALNNMIASGIKGVDFVALNTDRQALARSLTESRVQIGDSGLGAGARPEIGKQAAVASVDTIRGYLEGADMVFVTAGMGGGTGTGSAPVVASVAREVGALTVAVVTKPFGFEGKRRMRIAEEGLAELRREVDTVIVIPNQRLISVVEESLSFLDAFKVADEVLTQAVNGISELITTPGYINLDFADVRTVMKGMGAAVMGSGRATGAGRAEEAALKAISSPLLEDSSIDGARGVLINITGGPDMTLAEMNSAATLVRRAPTRTPRSSSARCSATTWTARSASPSSPPASRIRSPRCRCRSPASSVCPGW
jgi:cell division protein FtsZ